jgi:hypothetical protein
MKKDRLIFKRKLFGKNSYELTLYADKHLNDEDLKELISEIKKANKVRKTIEEEENNE